MFDSALVRIVVAVTLQNASAWRLTVSRCVRSSEYRTEGFWVTRHIQKRWPSLVNDMVGQSRPRGSISPSRGEASSESQLCQSTRGSIRKRQEKR
jgi:hypothetical protein